MQRFRSVIWLLSALAASAIPVASMAQISIRIAPPVTSRFLHPSWSRFLRPSSSQFLRPSPSQFLRPPSSRSLRRSCRSTSSPRFLRPATSGRLATGPMVRKDTSGFRAPGCSRPRSVFCGRRAIGAGETASTDGTPATGDRTLGSMAASITGSAMAASVSRADIGTMVCSPTIGPSTILAASRSRTCTARLSSPTPP